MHTAVNYYIVNLGISDFMVGFLVMPVKLLEMTAPAEWGMLNDTLCTVLLYVPTIVVFASVLTLVATCFERYPSTQSMHLLTYPYIIKIFGLFILSSCCVY